MQWQWWCSAQNVAWEWTWRPYPGVWLLLTLLVAGYVGLLRRVERRAPGPEARVGRGRFVVFSAAIACFWIALDWPVGALGAGYLASAHMLQFLLISLIAMPLLLFALPPAAYDAIRDRPRLHATIRRLTHPLIALVSFNLIVALTHAPTIADALKGTQAGSFVIDIAWMSGSLIFWWPLIATVPERSAMSIGPVKILYLTAQAILSTPLFVYLTYSSFPVYATYELAPRALALSALEDQQIAGVLMKVVGGMILMVSTAVLFFQWAARESDPMGESTAEPVEARGAEAAAP